MSQGAAAWGAFFAAKSIQVDEDKRDSDPTPFPTPFLTYAALPSLDGWTKSASRQQERISSVADEKWEEMRDPGKLRLVLEVLAGLCDGQNTAVQDYLRNQRLRNYLISDPIPLVLTGGYALAPIPPRHLP